MPEVRFELAERPTPASRPRVTQRGTFYPKAHTVYAEFLRKALEGVPGLSTDGPVELRLLFVMPRYKTSDHPVHRSDVDNLSKLPMDGMTKSGRFWKDDNLIVNLVALKRFAREGEEPHTKVRVVPVVGSVEDHVDALFNA